MQKTAQLCNKWFMLKLRKIQKHFFKVSVCVCRAFRTIKLYVMPSSCWLFLLQVHKDVELLNKYTSKLVAHVCKFFLFIRANNLFCSSLTGVAAPSTDEADRLIEETLRRTSGWVRPEDLLENLERRFLSLRKLRLSTLMKHVNRQTDGNTSTVERRTTDDKGSLTTKYRLKEDNAGGWVQLFKTSTLKTKITAVDLRRITTHRDEIKLQF